MKTKDAESRGAIQLAQGRSAVRGHLWVWVLGGPALGIHCPPLLSITQTCFCPLLTVLPQLPSGFTKSLTESHYPHQHNTQQRMEHGRQGAI